MHPNKSLEAWEELACVMCKLEGLSSRACDKNKSGLFKTFHGGGLLCFFGTLKAVGSSLIVNLVARLDCVQ